MVAGIVFLKVTGISYENYKIGGDIINFFLEPATISFAIPLYKNVMYLKILATNFWGIAIGTLIALILIYLVAIVFQLGDQIGASMLPQCYNCDRPSSITRYWWRQRVNVISRYSKCRCYFCIRY